MIKCLRTLPTAVLPTKAHESDIGYDLVAIKKHKVLDSGVILYDTGLSLSPPKGFYLEILPRSSLSKTGYMLANSVGVVDPSYTGSLYIALLKVVPDAPELELPFCKCQLILRRAYSAPIEEIAQLERTERGDGGFGSSGTRI
jgi:dUTP pyrophosphatase